jgi:hypothetical protein
MKLARACHQPSIESHKSKSRREAMDWCIEHRPRLTINEIGAGAASREGEGSHLSTRSPNE